jgi:hypothetical protein
MAHRALDVLDATLARERPVGRTIDEALAVLDDGDPDVEDELVAEGSIESDEYASPRKAGALDPEHRAGLATDQICLLTLPSRLGHSIRAPGGVA